MKSERLFFGGVLAFLIIIGFISNGGGPKSAKQGAAGGSSGQLELVAGGAGQSKTEGQTKTQEGASASKNGAGDPALGEGQKAAAEGEKSSAAGQKQGAEGESSSGQASSGAGSGEAAIPVQGKEDLKADIYVHVDGAVKRPGLYKLKEGQRLEEALRAAGGLREDASLTSVNLALRLADEMKVYIPTEAEEKENPTAFAATSGVASPGKASGNSTGGRSASGGSSGTGVQSGPSAQGSGAQGAGAQASGKVNINQASAEELQTLPSIGPRRAEDIIAYREQHPFKSLEELKNISGIGDKTFEKLKDKVTL